MRSPSIYRWAARIMSGAYIGFLVTFSFDTLKDGLARAFFIHNVPALVLAILTAIAWKWPCVGSVAYYGAALLYCRSVVRLVGAARIGWSTAISWYAVIGVPALCIATLFLLDQRARLIPSD